MNNKIRRWDKQRDTHLITLRLPATPTEIRKFLKTVEDFDEPWDGQTRYDPEESWMYVEFEMGTGLTLKGDKKEEQ